MKYWLFVNNRIIGPLSINEIIKKDYFHERLLVCPASLSGVDPSNWYFVKDLPEFENYVKTAVSVKEYVDDIFEVSTKSEDNYNIEEETYSISEYDNIVFENKVLKERLGIKEKELDEYRNKINYLEDKIFEIQKTLKKTQDIINGYESKLKEKDREIERLYKEISQKEEKQRKIENEAYTYKEDVIKQKDEEIERLQEEIKGLKNKQPEIESSRIDKVEEKIKELDETPLKTSDISNSLTETEKNELAELNLNEENKIEFEIPKFESISGAVPEDIDKEHAVEKNNDVVVADIKNDNAELNESPLNLSESTNEVLGVQLADSNQVEVEKTDTSVLDEQQSMTSDTEISVDNSEMDFGVKLSAEAETSYKKLKSVEINDSLIEEPVSFEDYKIDDSIETHELKSSKIESGTLPFQVAEINLDTVESKNLDKAEIKLEPVESGVQDVNVKSENTKTSELSLNEEKGQEDKVEFENVSETTVESGLEKEEAEIKTEKEEITVIENIEKTQISETEENKVIEEVKKQEESKGDEVITQTNQLSPENIIDRKISFRKEIKEDKVEKTVEKPETIKKADNKKRKIKISFKPLVKVFAAVLFIGIFVYSIIYILNSGSKDDKNVAVNVKYSFEKQNDEENTAVKKTSDVDLSTPPAVSENMNISQISINVKKAIDIVKNYQLGEGKGTVEKWLSNSYTVGREVKEEWSATLLTGSIFVVQYKVLRYKKEPIVYLFEVDVDKNEITRGINNNAIKLISGLNDNKTAKISPQKYKIISQNIESDEEMF